MTKVEYSSCSGPSYTDLLPQASAQEVHKHKENQGKKNSNVTNADVENREGGVRA